VRAFASILLPIGFALSTCSCAVHYWYDPAKTLNQARRDCRECYDQAVTLASEDLAHEYYSRSPEMRQRPYCSTRGDGLDPVDLGPLWESTFWGDTHRENLFRGCMKSRGYRLAREDQLGRRVRKSCVRTHKVAGR